MEHTPYRGRQSLDYGRGCWPQYSAEPDMEQSGTQAVVPFRGLGSSSWPSHRGGGGGDPRSSQQWRPGKGGIMSFTTPPTLSQVDILNAYGGGVGPPATAVATAAPAAGKYAYFLDRGRGRVTRLIPADMLPPLSEIPAQQARGPGMEVLPPLGGHPPNGFPDMNQRVTILVCIVDRTTTPGGKR